jgi:hypothetical protein
MADDIRESEEIGSCSEETEESMLCNLLSATAAFSDQAFQKRAWLEGLGSEVSTYTIEMLTVSRRLGDVLRR